MELQDLFTKDHEAFLHAFVAVAKILCPTADYYKIEEVRSVTDGGSTERENKLSLSIRTKKMVLHIHILIGSIRLTGWG